MVVPVLDRVDICNAGRCESVRDEWTYCLVIPCARWPVAHAVRDRVISLRRICHVNLETELNLGAWGYPASKRDLLSHLYVRVCVDQFEASV